MPCNLVCVLRRGVLPTSELSFVVASIPLSLLMPPLDFCIRFIGLDCIYS